MFDFTHPFYKPMWRRVAIVVFCLLFGGLEFLTGSPLFGVIFVSIGGGVFWKLFLDKDTIEKLDADQEPDELK